MLRRFTSSVDALTKQKTSINKINESIKIAMQGGGQSRIDAQYAKGKLTARDRISALLDTTSPFDELDALHGTSNDGVIVGTGNIWGRPVVVFSQDFTVMGGSLGAVHAKKIVKGLKAAERMSCPVIGLNDSGGARIQEGIDALAGYGEIFHENVRLSGVVPQLSLIMGPCAGGAVYSPALTDFCFMLRKTAYMFVTGPDVVEAVTHEAMSLEELGGADVHCRISGVCHGAYNDELEALSGIRNLLRFLPQCNTELAPLLQYNDPDDRADSSLDTIVPWDSNKSYDMREIIRVIVDNRQFMELQSEFAENIIIGFAHLGGISVGVVGNQPLFSSGVLDIDSSCKAARFVRFCDAFNIPIVTLVDVPGFLPGKTQEHGGIIRHGAKLLHAYAACTTPRFTIITRKAYGGAYDVMSSRHLASDRVYGWPTAEIAVMGKEGAKKILKGSSEVDSEVLVAASKGHIDAILMPRETRPRLIRDLKAHTKCVNTGSKGLWKKQGNIPL